MRSLANCCSIREQGFSLIEILVALLITVVVMAAVFGLLQKGQTSFNREPEITDLNQSARVGLDMIARDLTMAGYKTPPVMAIMWTDGGGITPDSITIVYADDEIPTSTPCKCADLQGGTASLLYGPRDLPSWLRLENWSRWARHSSAGKSGIGLERWPGLANPAAGPRWAGFFGRWLDWFLPGTGKSGGGGGCGPANTIDQSSTLNLDPDTFDPPQVNPAQAYADGMVLFAFETGDCNEDGQLGIYPFEVTQPPRMTMAGGLPTLQVNHNPGQGETDINQPGGFNRQVNPDCCIIGLFRVVEYRIFPPPPTPNPALERRDIGIGTGWTPVSANIENLQIQYAVGSSNIFVDSPATPNYLDPNTWITRVKVTVAGRTESTNLQGASQGVFQAEDTHLRKTFSTTVSLRNQMFAAAEASDSLNYN